MRPRVEKEYLEYTSTKYFLHSKLLIKMFKLLVHLFQNSLAAKLTGKEGEAHITFFYCTICEEWKGRENEALYG